MNEPNILLNKSSKAGEYIRVKELLVILKKELRNSKDEKQIITVNTVNYSAEPLTTVLKCSKCDSLHFESSFRMDTILDVDDIVFEDKSNVSDEDDAYIGIKEHIEILELEAINKDTEITLTNSYSPMVESLTIVYKCGEGCSALHLSSGFEQPNYINN